MEKVVLISTGDELVTGGVVDTNSSYIANHLYPLGLEVVTVLKVGDASAKLFWALQQGVELGDLIIGTGGLGWPGDSLAKATVANFLGRKQAINEVAAERLKRRFETRGRHWSLNDRKQALFPEGAEIIPNPLGFTLGFRVSFGRQKALIWLPGVANEMGAMLRESVLPWAAQKRQRRRKISVCTFKIHGLTELQLADILRRIPLTEGANFSIRAHYPDLSLRLTVSGARGREKTFQRIRAQSRDLIHRYIYSEGEESLEETVGRLLLEKQWTLAMAESCTGGFVSHRITRVAGSSVYFKGAAVTYSNESKIHFLGVRRKTLEQHGAVSRETALQMARGIRRQAGTSIGLSVTGIAGPTGGSFEKPVGTVWMGLAYGEQSDARHFCFEGDREHVILGASQAALHWLRMVLS
ncbi:MAG: CinA family nicotinamide mononucleotide deamidase-related protein [Candidatus Binatia bacterium]